MKFLANIFRKISASIENRIEYIDKKPVDKFMEEVEKQGLSELSSPKTRMNHANGSQAISEKLESDRNQNQG